MTILYFTILKTAFTILQFGSELPYLLDKLVVIVGFTILKGACLKNCKIHFVENVSLVKNPRKSLPLQSNIYSQELFINLERYKGVIFLRLNLIIFKVVKIVKPILTGFTCYFYNFEFGPMQNCKNRKTSVNEYLNKP